MTENPETIRLLMAAIERIDDKLEALDNKFEKKMEQLGQKLDGSMREFQKDVQDLRGNLNRIDSNCQHRRCIGEDQAFTIKELQKELHGLKTELQMVKNNEWRLFFRQLGKAAAYVVGIGTAVVLLQQIFGFGGAKSLVSEPQPAPTEVAPQQQPPPYLRHPFPGQP